MKGSVAGVQPPAFVERSRTSATSSTDHLEGVSPGFNPRPSLSDLHSAGKRPKAGKGVAGVQPPAFVERMHDSSVTAPGIRQVSPGFNPRPSLSANRADEGTDEAAVSPGFNPRPSLSGPAIAGQPLPNQVSPGFNPRPSLSAGRHVRHRKFFVVSPGFNPRPSLSDRQPWRTMTGEGCTCRRGSTPGLR